MSPSLFRTGTALLARLVPRRSLCTPQQSQRLEPPTHRVNNLERRFLVWTGKYKSVAEVPEHVPQSVMERARNRMRIKISNYMMLTTALACVVMVVAGKRAAERGESVQKENLSWHAQMKREDAEKQAAAAKQG